MTHSMFSAVGTVWVRIDQETYLVASLAHRPENKNRPYAVRWREGGSNRRLSFKLKSEAKAHLTRALAIEEAERSGVRASPAQVRNRTLDEQYEMFIEQRRTEVAKTTVDKHRWIYEVWLKPTLRTRKLGTIGPDDLTKILAAATDAGKGNDTRIAIYQTLNQLLDRALGKGGHSCREARAGQSKRNREIIPLTDDELDRLIEATPEAHRLLVDVMATLGVRPHEALGIRARDVRDGTVTVESRKGNAAGKRTLPLPARLREPLSALVDDLAPDDLVFDVSDYRNWVRRVFNPAVERASLTNVVPYSLRHTAASKLIARGATPADVAEWLGHSVRMTLQTYAHLFAGRKHELAQLLDR